MKPSRSIDQKLMATSSSQDTKGVQAQDRRREHHRLRQEDIRSGCWGAEIRPVGKKVSCHRLAGASEQRIDMEAKYSEAWRYQGVFTRFNRFKNALPGLGIATVAFAAYCGYEYFFLEVKHHGEGHESDHH